MPTSQIKVNVRQEGRVAVFDLRGDVDGYAAEPLEAAYARAEGDDAQAILLNFAEAEYMNSKGIALIVVLLSRVRKAGRKLLACGLTDHYLEIFQITRLSDYIATYADEETALAAIQAPDMSKDQVPVWERVEAF